MELRCLPNRRYLCLLGNHLLKLNRPTYRSKSNNWCGAYDFRTLNSADAFREAKPFEVDIAVNNNRASSGRIPTRRTFSVWVLVFLYASLLLFISSSALSYLCTSQTFMQFESAVEHGTMASSWLHSYAFFAYVVMCFYILSVRTIPPCKLVLRSSEFFCGMLCISYAPALFTCGDRQ